MSIRTILILSALLMFTTCSYADPNRLDAKYDDLYSFDLSSYLKLNYYKFTPGNNKLKELSFNNWENVPGAVKLEVVGIHGIVLNQLQTRMIHYVRDDLKLRYNSSNMLYSDFQRRWAIVGNKYNPYGDWWNRSWLYSLPPEKGGAPKYATIYQFGWDLDFSIIPFVGWIRDQLAKLGDVWISSDHEFIEEGKGPQPRFGQGQTGDTPSDPISFMQFDPNRVDFGIDQPHQWFEGNFYHFRFKPTMRFKPAENEGWIDAATFRMQIELFTRKKTKHFATIGFLIKYNIPDDETFFSLFLDLVNF